MIKIYLLVALSLVVGCNKAKEQPVAMVVVGVGEVSRKVVFLGRVRSEQSALARAPIDGILVNLSTSVGSPIKKGDPIAVLQQPKNESRLTNLIEDQGRLKQVRLKQSSLKLQIKTSERNLQQTARLVASGSIANSEHEDSKVAFELLEKQHDALVAEEANILEAMNFKQNVQSGSTKTVIAPAAGMVTQLWMPQEDITEGISIVKDTILATIEMPGKYVVKGDVTEADFIRLKVGQDASITLLHGDSKTLAGKIKSISPMARQDNFGVGRFDILASFASQSDVLRSGLEARGEVVLEKRDRVLRVPRSALREVDKHFFVSLPGKNGPQRALVGIGLVGDEFVEIVSGLQANHRVYEAYVDASR